MTNNEWIMFEGRMVHRDAASHAEAVRRMPYHFAGFGSQMASDPNNPENRAARILDESHKAWRKIQRKKEREKEEQAYREAMWAARQIDLPLTPVWEDPEVAALRERIEAEAEDASARLATARAAHAEAVAGYEAADRLAIEAEIQAELENSGADAANPARAAAHEAARRLGQAEAALKEAEGEARRQAQRVAVLKERLAGAEARATQTFQSEGMRLLCAEVELTRAAMAAAVEANERLFRTAIALEQAGVKFFASPHYRGLLRPELEGHHTPYADWLEWLEAYIVTAENVD